MLIHGFPPKWSAIKKLIWLVGTGIAGAASGIWKTVTGTLIHLTDALASPMQKCEVTLEPIQDLHGQDAPYPAGGGKNIVPTTFPSNVINASFSSNGNITAATNARTFAIPCEPNTDYVASSKSGLAVTIGLSTTLPTVGGSLTYVCTFTSRTWYDFNSGNNSYIILAFASTDLFNEHESTYQFMIEKGSTATAFAPYENICPITGWTGCEVTRTGANLFDNSNMIPSMRIDAGVVGAHSSYNLFVVPVKENTQYTFNQTGARTGYPIFAQSNKYPESGDTVYNQTNIRNNDTFTFNSGNYKYALFALYKSAGNDFSVAVGTDAIPIDTPYQGTTLSVTFPDSAGTVYGGTYDFVSGVLTVTHKYASLTGLVWSGNVNDTLAIEAYTHSISGKKKGATNIISDKLKTISPFINKAEYTVRGFAQDGDIAVKIPKAVASDYTELKTWVDNNDVHVCFELDEPFTIQLTPQQISTLAGENNVWGDGNIEMTYKAQAS